MDSLDLMCSVTVTDSFNTPSLMFLLNAGNQSISLEDSDMLNQCYSKSNTNNSVSNNTKNCKIAKNRSYDYHSGNYVKNEMDNKKNQSKYKRLISAKNMICIKSKLKSEVFRNINSHCDKSPNMHTQDLFCDKINESTLKKSTYTTKWLQHLYGKGNRDKFVYKFKNLINNSDENSFMHPTDLKNIHRHTTKNSITKPKYLIPKTNQTKERIYNNFLTQMHKH